MPFGLTDVMMLEPGIPGAAQSSGSGNTTDQIGRLVNGAVATGTAKSQQFTLGGMRDGVLTLTSDLGVNITAFKVDLEVLINGNWVKVSTANDLFTVQQIRLAVAPGSVYRLNVTTYTASSGTPACNVFGSYAPLSA